MIAAKHKAKVFSAYVCICVAFYHYDDDDTLGYCQRSYVVREVAVTI